MSSLAKSEIIILNLIWDINVIIPEISKIKGGVAYQITNGYIQIIKKEAQPLNLIGYTHKPVKSTLKAALTAAKITPYSKSPILVSNWLFHLTRMLDLLKPKVHRVKVYKSNKMVGGNSD